MWCACRCFFAACRDWMYNISHSLNIHDLSTLFEEKDKKDREAETAADCGECVSVTACYLWTHRKIPLHCFSCHLASVTKAGKIGFIGRKEKEVSISKHLKPYQHPLCFCAGDWRSAVGFNRLFSSCHIRDPPHYNSKICRKTKLRERTFLNENRWVSATYYRGITI